MNDLQLFMRLYMYEWKYGFQIIKRASEYFFSQMKQILTDL